MSKFWTKQWSFMWAGLAFGLAQIFYMVGNFFPAWAAGKTPSVEPITVTTDLGKMFRGMEVFLCKTLGISDTQIYGTSVMLANGDWIPTAQGAFVPGVGWPIVGMMLGGLLVAIIEREGRGWAKYDWQVLTIAFFGGALFSYGTRLAGGCTLNHLLGGVPMMNIHSMVAVGFMSLGGLAGFFLMGLVDRAKYFKHQETLDYAKESYEKGNYTDCVCYDPDYKPKKDMIRWLGIAFSVIFFGVGIVGGLFNPEMFQYAKDAAHLDQLKDFGKSIDHKGLAYVLLTLAAGIIGGFGMAKSGFGTECGLLTAEAHHFTTKNDTVMDRFNMPKITKTLFRGMMPLVGISAMWVLVSAFIIVTWGFLNYEHGFTGDIKYALTAGVPIGGFILGMGAVLLIGCEIRSYMRIGLGYTNTMVGFAGFAMGYIPFTLYYKEHMEFFYATDWLGTEAAMAAGEAGLYHVPQLFSDNHWVQVGIAIVWFVLLVKLFKWAINKGARALGTTTDVIAHKNTEDVHRLTYVEELYAKTAERLGLDEYQHLSGFDHWMNRTFGKK
ncbi:MAG: YeeE/YedE family protein [Campylobacterales bacterium]|nr:YeeE/YedE family protein [Campylobacterales bacterium]